MELGLGLGLGLRLRLGLRLGLGVGRLGLANRHRRPRCVRGVIRTGVAIRPQGGEASYRLETGHATKGDGKRAAPRVRVRVRNRNRNSK